MQTIFAHPSPARTPILARNSDCHPRQAMPQCILLGRMSSMQFPFAGQPYAKPRSFPKWAIALIVIAVVLVVVLCGCSLFLLIESWFHSSPPYQQALKQAQTAPCVVNTIGTPVQASWLTAGDLNENNDAGSANFDIPIHGPKDAGSLELEATRSKGVWQITSLVFAHRTDRFQLLPPSPACQ